jgi:Zn-dependent alcohol dehydrogenase
LLGPVRCGIQSGTEVVINALKVDPGRSFATFGSGALGWIEFRHGGTRVGRDDNHWPDLVIPALVELYTQGRFTFDKLVKFYTLNQINRRPKTARRALPSSPSCVFSPDPPEVSMLPA